MGKKEKKLKRKNGQAQKCRKTTRGIHGVSPDIFRNIVPYVQ